MSRNTKKGFSLLETVIYIVLMSAILLIVINVLITLLQSQSKIFATRSVENTATSVIGRIGRDIRAADSINLASTTFDTHPGTLSLDTSATSTITNIEYGLAGDVLHLYENNLDRGPLSASGATITNIVFSAATTSTSTLISIDMAVMAGDGQYIQTKNFRDSFLMRTGYVE